MLSLPKYASRTFELFFGVAFVRKRVCRESSPSPAESRLLRSPALRVVSAHRWLLLERSILAAGRFAHAARKSQCDASACVAGASSSRSGIVGWTVSKSPLPTSRTVSRCNTPAQAKGTVEPTSGARARGCCSSTRRGSRMDCRFHSREKRATPVAARGVVSCSCRQYRLSDD